MPEASSFLDALTPLKRFWGCANEDLFTPIDGIDMPEPYRRLLVHDKDMTPTLEAYHQDTIGLNVLDAQETDDAWHRHVLLVLKKSQLTVEYGGIRIYLDHFPPQSIPAIREGSIPLGTLLTTHRIQHSSTKRHYFSVPQKGRLKDYFPGRTETCFGRCNRMISPKGHILADIVEILPPMATSE